MIWLFLGAAGRRASQASGYVRGWRLRDAFVGFDPVGGINNSITHNKNCVIFACFSPRNYKYLIDEM